MGEKDMRKLWIDTDTASDDAVARTHDGRGRRVDGPFDALILSLLRLEAFRQIPETPHQIAGSQRGQNERGRKQNAGYSSKFFHRITKAVGTTSPVTSRILG